MCGIVSLVSKKDYSLSDFIDKLLLLEYRGYDSKGIAYLSDQNFIIEKTLDDLNISKNIKSRIMIGHTRWATHGKVSLENAHPHIYKDIIIVHNGICDINIDYNGYSQTDTEKIAYLLYQNRHNIIDFLTNTNLGKSYAFVFIYQNIVYGFSKNASLYLYRENENIGFTSDISIFTSCEYVLIDGLATIDIKQNYRLYNQNQKFTKVNSMTRLGGQKNITQYELYEVPEIVKKITQKNLPIIPSYATGCGSSFFSALALERYSNFTIQALNINNVKLDKHIYIFSQSGETMDILNRIGNYKNFTAITNRVNSKLDLLSKESIYLNAGNEIGVAATKSVIIQFIISKMMFHQVNIDFTGVIKLNLKSYIDKLSTMKKIVILGSSFYYPVALEAALKMTELLYIPVLGLETNEFKHGYLALVDSDTCVILFESDHVLEQIKTRNGNVILLDTECEITALFLIHRLAIELCLHKGLNLDKPRNLAKSITVL